MSPTHGKTDLEAHTYDAILILSFGGPEGHDDVMPFLERVTRGRGVPRERLEEVAHHYHLFGGVSPINEQNRALIQSLEDLLDAEGPALPVYWGNRNWHPLIEETMERMKVDGVQRALAFVTSAFSSYSACRQYREDITRAQASVGAGAPIVDKIRHFYNHPGFIEPQADKVRIAIGSIPEERRAAARLAFTAHSVPVAMASASDYEAQLQEACHLVAERTAPDARWDLVYQSRSGAPHVPWLEPDILDHLATLSAQEVTDVVVVPIGFVSDHLEVRFDLDVEAVAKAADLGINLVRAQTVGAHPAFVRMIRDLIRERIEGTEERLALGRRGPSHDICAADCCAFEGMAKRPSPGEAQTFSS